MIELTQAYKVGEVTYPTLFDAQCKAIAKATYGDTAMPEGGAAVIQQIVAAKDQVLSILTMSEPKERTRKPRSDRGKKHKPQTVDEVRRIPEVATPGVKVEGSGKYKNT